MPTLDASAEAVVPGIGVALRRVVVGYRVVGAVWLVLLGMVVLAGGVSRPLVVVGTAVLALAWAGLTVALAVRRPDALRTWWWLAADVAVAGWTVLAPSAGTGGEPFYGGYPFSAVLLAAYMLRLPGGLVAACALAAISVVRLGLEGFAALPGLVGTVVLYVAGAAVAAWGSGVIHRHDSERRRAEAALAEERAERIRTQERAETAAHLHDSVLQTLALIQRRTDDPAEVAALARGQERALRDWLAEGQGGRTGAVSFVQELEATAEQVERLHRIVVDFVTVGDAAMDEGLRALVAAAGEAITNAARHAQVPRVSVYAEVGDAGVQVFVRDRGVGFDPDRVAADRRGIRESIVGRLARHEGDAQVRSTPGAGTEVSLTMSRRASTRDEVRR